MKTRINLFQAQYKPALSLLSLNSVVFFNVLLLLVVVLFTGFLGWRSDTLIEENKSLNLRVDTAQNRVNALQSELELRQPNPALLATIEQQKIALQQRQKLLEELSVREQGKQSRFSVMLNDLTTADTPHIWLTQIQLTEGKVDLFGYGNKADAMPIWLSRLSNTESFKGQTFEHVSMQRDDTAIRFQLNTDLADAIVQRGTQ